MAERVTFEREDLVRKFVEVTEPPVALTTAFERHPLCHLLSKYTIRPVACDQHPFVIHHKNKQPMLLQQKKPRARQNDKGKEVDNFDSDNEEEDDDDEFETVRADKKRG